MSFTTFLATYLLKISDSIKQFPADPGVDYLAAAIHNRWSSIFQFADGQLIVGNRILSILVSYLPVSSHAITTGLLVAILWAAGGTLLVAACLKITVKTVWSFAVGLIIVLAPASSESQLGNNGGTRWLLYLAIAFTFSTERVIEFVSNSQTRKGLLFGFTLLLGLTNPMSFAILPFLLLAIYSVRKYPDQKILKVYVTSAVLLVATTLVQICVLLISKHELGRHSTATYKLWAGSGFYWKFIFGAPIAICCITMLFVFRRFSSLRNGRVVVFLIGHAFSIYITTYILGGIADRYLIAPFVLACAALFISLGESDTKVQRHRYVLPLLTIAVIVIASVIWFSPTGYLTSGKDWSSQIPSARTMCEIEKSESVMMIFSNGHPNDVPCQYIQSGN